MNPSGKLNKDTSIGKVDMLVYPDVLTDCIGLPQIYSRKTEKKRN